MTWNVPLPAVGGKKHRLTSDSHGYQVQRFEGTTKDGRPQWQGVVFGGTPEQAIDAFAALALRLSNVDSFPRAREEAESIAAALAGARREVK